MIFCMRRIKKPKKYAKERELSGWNDMTMWMDFRPSYVSEAVWVESIHHVMSARVTQWLQFGAKNLNRRVQGSITMHIGNSIPFISHVKRLSGCY